jgi:hypothetical protein
VISVRHKASPRSRAISAHTHAADLAYRYAWCSLALYPLTLVAAFAIGEGLYSEITNDQGNIAAWQVLVAATPAMLVFVVPGVIAVALGRKAVRLGRRDGRVPAIVGTAIALGFVAQNILSYCARLLFG